MFCKVFFPGFSFALVVCLFGSGFGGSVEKVIRRQVADQSSYKEGGYYHSLLKENAFQDSVDLAKARKSLSFERKRDAEAAKLAGQGPITLDKLLSFGLEFNDQVLADRAGLRAVNGERLMVFSRFLPHVSYLYRGVQSDSGFTGKTDRTEGHALRITQDFLEFGRESDTSFNFRQARRSALFAYEETVGKVLKNIRIRFFAILLWQEQIKERQLLLKEYRERYGRMQELEKVRRVLEADVLTSRLNVLHEEARINSLQKELFRQKLDLQKWAGFPVVPLEFTLQGALEPVKLDMEECVNLALRRSTAVAEARARKSDQQRISNRAWWEHGPDVNIEFKWKKKDNAAGVVLDRNQGTYKLQGFGERFLRGPDTLLAPSDPFYSANNPGWRFDATAEFPLFQGFGAVGKQKREWALLDYTTFDLRRVVDSVELVVRNTYQTMLELEQALEILKETASISQERLKIQESLKELGKITDNELETFRNRFFDDQSEYYNGEIGWIEAQEELRFVMRWFEVETLKGEH